MCKEKIYPKKNPLPLIMYPPQMYTNDIGEKFLYEVANIEMAETESFGMYLAIPFCIQPCLSCPYFIEVMPDNDKLEKYIEALTLDLKRWSSHGRFKKGKLRTVYIGGGTGSIINNHLLKKVLDTVYENFVFDKDLTITLEGNPVDFTKEKVEFILQDKRITAISIGVQSFNDDVLKRLGAPHTGKQAYDSIKLLKEKGFDSFNVDLIFNMPFHTIKEWEDDLSALKALDVKHFTIYPYRLHWNSVQLKKIQDGEIPKLRDVESDYVKKMQEMAQKTAQEMNMNMYMPNYWCCDGFELPYNHWNFRVGADTLGVGPGAYSYINGVRFGSAKNVNEYIKKSFAGEHYISTASEKLSKRHQMERFIIQCLHCLKVDFDIFYKRFNIDIREEFGEVLSKLYAKGVLMEVSDGITFTQLGAEWPINVLLEFFDDCYWGDKSAQSLPVWAMNESMVDLITVEKKEWLGE